MQKAQLRDQFTQHRRARSAEEITRARESVCGHVLRRCASDGWGTVAGYVPLRTEPGSTELLDALLARRVRVLVPHLLPDLDLDWTAWPDAARLGTSAIARVDAVLVPALAVARDGTRLGRGGGSYDRALARVSDGVAVYALLYDDELVDQLPSDEWDVPVAEVVSPAGWHQLRESGTRGTR